MATGQNGELANAIVCGVMVLDLVLEPKNLIRNLSVAPSLRARTLFALLMQYLANLLLICFGCVRFHKGKIDVKATGT